MFVGGQFVNLICKRQKMLVRTGTNCLIKLQFRQIVLQRNESVGIVY